MNYRGTLCLLNNLMPVPHWTLGRQTFSQQVRIRITRRIELTRTELRKTSICPQDRRNKRSMSRRKLTPEQSFFSSIYKFFFQQLMSEVKQNMRAHYLKKQNMRATLVINPIKKIRHGSKVVSLYTANKLQITS